MPINWADKDSQERLLAAMWEAGGDKKRNAEESGSQKKQLDYKKMASLFGRDATYSTIENRMRSVRKLGEKLRKEAEKSSRITDSKASPKKNTTDRVAKGRVTKAQGKKKAPRAPKSAKFKKEESEAPETPDAESAEEGGLNSHDEEAMGIEIMLKYEGLED